MNHVPLDTSSMQGLLISISCILLAWVFKTLSVLTFLQGFSYLCAIVLAIDTLSGNNLKNSIVNKIKQVKDKRRASNKSKRNRDKSN